MKKVTVTYDEHKAGFVYEKLEYAISCGATETALEYLAQFVDVMCGNPVKEVKT